MYLPKTEKHRNKHAGVADEKGLRTIVSNPLPLCDCTFYGHLSLQRVLGLFSFYSGSWAETKTYILINFYSEIIRNNPTQKRKTKNTRQSLIYNFQVGKK